MTFIGRGKGAPGVPGKKLGNDDGKPKSVARKGGGKDLSSTKKGPVVISTGKGSPFKKKTTDSSGNSSAPIRKFDSNRGRISPENRQKLPQPFGPKKKGIPGQDFKGQKQQPGGGLDDFKRQDQGEKKGGFDSSPSDSGGLGKKELSDQFDGK